MTDGLLKEEVANMQEITVVNPGFRFFGLKSVECGEKQKFKFKKNANLSRTHR